MKIWRVEFCQATSSTVVALDEKPVLLKNLLFLPPPHSQAFQRLYPEYSLVSDFSSGKSILHKWTHKRKLFAHNQELLKEKV